MNTELLIKVEQKILEEPSRFRMRRWHDYQSGCGTAHCIGGHAVALSGKVKEHTDSYEDEGDEAAWDLPTELLQLTDKQALRLFSITYWPPEFRLYYRDDGSRESAEIAAGRIRRFIETGGCE